MHAPMPLDEFYRQTMAANGIVREPEPVEKVAEARGEDVEVAKLAKAVFDQTRLDDVKYASAKDRLDDSFKIARAYVDYMTSVKTASANLANNLLRVAAHAVEGYLAQNGISKLSAFDGIKIAAVCAEELIQKVAEPGSDFAMEMLAAREKGDDKDDDDKDGKKDDKKDDKDGKK